MKEISRKQKNLAIVAAILISVVVMFALFSWYILSVNKLSQTGTTPNKNTESVEVPNQSAQTLDSNKEAINYSVAEINKKDGDVFSLPDHIAFVISPDVENSHVKLLYQDGTTIYDQSVDGGKGDLTVYPDRKLGVGDTGKIIVEGIVDGKTVVTKEVRVVF